MIYNRRFTLSAALILSFLGCTSGSSAGIVEDGAAAAIVYGNVVDSKGDPLVNATVSAEARFPNCAGTVRTRSGSQNVLRTTTSGRFSVLLILPSAPGLHCVRLSVTPATATTATVVEIPAVMFRFNNRDSVQQNVAVTP